MADALPTDRLLRMFLEQAREHAVMLVDRDGQIRWSNPAANRIFGRDLAGQPLSVLFTPEDVALGMPAYELSTAAAHGVAEDDRWLIRNDGSRFWASGLMIAVRDEQGELLAFGKILRNRTDLWEQMETLRNQVGECEQRHRRKDVFLSTLSHELRTPLAPLSNAIQLMRMTSTPDPDQDRPVRIIERQVESLKRLVDDLLDVSRIEAGKIELKREVVMLQQIINRAVEKVRPRIDGRRQRMDVLVPPNPIRVVADPARLEQVFVNLLDNAAKYTPEEGRIWIKATTDGAEAVVHIEDTGIGIPPEMLPRIFELFTQVETSRRQSQGGLGIGLSLVKKLVALHGGSVQVRSEGPGKGSEFSVRLPLSSSP